MRQLRRIALPLALCTITAATALPTLAQDKKVELRISTWMPPSQPVVPVLQVWLDDITKQSGGTITGKIFPAEQLGKAMDHYDMARDGIADVALPVTGYQPGRFPIMEATSLPLLFSNGKAGSAALDAWYRPYAKSEMKDVHYCTTFTSEPATYHSRKKIQLPEDIRGLKIRQANSVIGQMNVLLGATNVQASAPETRDMLERGVADAITFPWGSLFLFGIDKAVKYHLDVPLYTASVSVVMNKSKYESLSPAQRKVIDDHCTPGWAEKLASPWADFESDGRKKLAAMPEHELVKLTPEQLVQWRKAVADTQAKWAEGVQKTGQNPTAVLNGLKESLKKYNSLL